MSKYTFICEEESTSYSTAIESKKTVEFRADSLNDVLEQFESFLRGSGFYFKGTLDIVDYEFEDTEPDWNIPKEKTNFDFSGIPNNNFPFTSTGSNDIALDLGTAQPAIFPLDTDIIQFPIEASEKCPVCKIPKSVMKSEKCYDSQCPKTSWLMDLDYKLASEK